MPDPGSPTFQPPSYPVDPAPLAKATDDSILVLTKADAPPPPPSPGAAKPARFQRTMIGMGGVFGVMMSSLDRMPDAISRMTGIPYSVIEQIRCGHAETVPFASICAFAEALDCEIEMRLAPRAPRS